MSNLLESEEKGFESTEGGEASRERESFSFSSRFSPSRTLPVFFFFLSLIEEQSKNRGSVSLCVSRTCIPSHTSITCCYLLPAHLRRNASES